jgi:hypothetical protein
MRLFLCEEVNDEFFLISFFSLHIITLLARDGESGSNGRNKTFSRNVIIHFESGHERVSCPLFSTQLLVIQSLARRRFGIREGN